MDNWFSNAAPLRSLPIGDRGIQYGDGLFETIAIRKGEPRLWPLHSNRLARGCEVLSIKMPSDEELADGIAHAIRSSDVSADFCVVKIIVTAGESLRGYGRAPSTAPNVLFGAFASAPLPVSYYRDGIETTVCRTRLSMHSPTAGLKTLNRIEQVLARSELVENKRFEGLTLDADDHVICGTMSNVFLVKDNLITTPPVDSCGVAGIMREHVMTCLAKSGRSVRLEKIKRPALGDVDEVFMSNSQFGVLPIASCDAMQWGVGKVTQDVMAVMAAAGIVECLS